MRRPFMPSMGGRFYSIMLHDDIQQVEQRVNRMQEAVDALRAEVQELTIQVSDALKRLDVKPEQPRTTKAAKAEK